MQNDPVPGPAGEGAPVRTPGAGDGGPEKGQRVGPAHVVVAGPHALQIHLGRHRGLGLTAEDRHLVTARGQPLALLPQDPGAAAVGFERRDIGHHQDPELSHGPLP